MSHQALYRQYRPKTFDDVVEQQHVVTTLKNTVMSGKLAHAYLFCGTRGTGKTTMAKVFARAVNCLHPDNGNPCNQCELCRGILEGTIFDVIEMDAASNNSVDNVRDIIDEVVYAPTRAAYKVYIIDEVHMLSSGAFNALLKTLEEPPEHVLFILATTEPHKLPATVLSRCQRFDFRRISINGMVKRLLMISKEAGITITDEAAQFIASLAEGALRDGISLLDQCIATGKEAFDLDSVQDILGIASGKLVLATGECLINRDSKEVIHMIDQLFSSGRDPGQFVQNLTRIFRDILVYQFSHSVETLLCMTEEERKEIPRLSEKVSHTEALAIEKELAGMESGMKWSASPKITMEMGFLRICLRELNQDENTLMERIQLLEERIRHLEDGLSAYHANPKAASILPENSVKEEDKKQSDASADIKSVERQKVRERPEPIKQKEEGILNTHKPFDKWDCVLDKLKSTGCMKLFSSLIGATAVWVADDVIGIIIEEEDVFKRSVLNKNENLERLSGAVKDCTGRNLAVKTLSPRREETKDPNIPDAVLAFAKKNGLHLDIVEE